MVLDYDNVNGDLRLNRLLYKDSTSATLADYEYTRRDDGHITSWSNSQTGDDWDLTYDGAGRLTEVKDGGVTQYQYTYDGLGNKDEFILGTGTLDGDFNGLNQLTQMKDGTGTPIESFTYDDNGNLLTDGTNAYTWDLKDRLVEIDDGTHVTEIKYDAFDRWIQVTTTETSSSTVTVDHAFVWCGTTICQERDGASTGTVERELYGTIGHQEGSINRFYLRDHLSSTRGMVNDSEVVTSSFAYDPYGRMTTLSGTETPSYGYAQLWYHGQTDLNIAVWRAYNPEIGRWINRDPIGERGGINVYEYTLSNPINAVDILGLETTVYVWEAVGWGASSFGHVSVDINGTTYSFAPGGMGTYSWDQYSSNNEFRGAWGLDLDIDAWEEDWLEDFLSDYDKDYNALENNCTDPIQQGLNQLGRELSGRSLLPTGLGVNLWNNDLVSGSEYVPAVEPSTGVSAPWTNWTKSGGYPWVH